MADESDVDPVQQRNDAWEARQELAAAIDRIRAEYERQARPFIAQQHRNPGPMRPELAALARERDARIRDLTRQHQLGDAMERATMDRPGRVASDRERQAGQAAARAFAMDLGKGHYVSAEPEPAGRNVHDTWIW